MKVDKIPFDVTGKFSTLFVDYLKGSDKVKPFYAAFPDPESLKSIIETRKLDTSQEESDRRKALSMVIEKQYRDLDVTEMVKDNISKLRKSSTFTVTTGHQLNIFTGPLYFIYKIVTAINACKELKKRIPENDFVPVYWMASEDHDFEEISFVHVFGKKYQWENGESGAVGRMSCTSLEPLINELPGDLSIFQRAYSQNDNLADAVRCYVNDLFGDEGLVVLDPDNSDLKSMIAPIIEDDLFEGTAHAKVEETARSLKELGYKGQIHSREINFFYLDNGFRERIVRNNDKFEVVNSQMEFSKDEILEEIKNHPEKFSPNVILRPVYQEAILPNLIYIGGPAEVDYWLQLKGVFDHYKIPFPVVMPRNFALYINHVANRKVQKTGAGVTDLFLPKPKFQNRRVTELSNKELDLAGESKEVSAIFNRLESKASNVDITLQKLVKAELAKANNAVEKIRLKMTKAEKRHHDDLIRQIDEWHNMLFPKGKDQERTLNYLNFQVEDPEFLNKIKSALDPFDLRYHVITDEGN